MKALIGHTGFVGSNILDQCHFDECYNSKNIEQIRGKEFDLIVCAGVSSVKWKANKEPLEDFKQIERLIQNIEHTAFSKLVLISTIAVYDNPADNPYDRHRLYLETYLANKHDNVTTIRLPSLFGKGLKKNAIYDLMHNDHRFLPHKDSQFQYYSLDNIGRDIEIAVSKDLKTLNITSEPVRFYDILELFGVEHSSTNLKTIIYEDMKSDHAAYWGKSGPYLYDKNETAAQLERFIKRNAL